MAYGTAGGTGAADEGVVLLEHNTLLQLLFWRRVQYRRKATDREEFSCEPPPTSPPHHTVLHVFVTFFRFGFFIFVRRTRRESQRGQKMSRSEEIIEGGRFTPVETRDRSRCSVRVRKRIMCVAAESTHRRSARQSQGRHTETRTRYQSESHG